MPCCRTIAAVLVLGQSPVFGQSVAWASPSATSPTGSLGPRAPSAAESTTTGSTTSLPPPLPLGSTTPYPTGSSPKAKKRVAALSPQPSLVPDPRTFRFTLADPVLTTRPWRGSPFNVKLGVDLPLIAVGLATKFGAMFVKTKAPDPASLNASDVNAFDRGVIGNHSATADKISTGLMAASIVLPVAADFVDVLVNKPDDGLKGFAKDLVVLAEVYAVTSMITNITKLTIHRARPFMYDPATPAAERQSGDAMQSFYSGHSSTAFAMATAYSYLFMKRHPKSPWIIPMWVGTEALAATTAVMRVEAGKHYWSDVLVGAAVGSAVGFLIPWLHRSKTGKYVSEMMFEGEPGKLRLAPTVLPGGGGLNVKMVW